MENYSKIWMRAGLNLLATPDEANVILSDTDDSPDGLKAILSILDDGRFEFSGGSYVPESVVSKYNREHGTGFSDGDVDYALPTTKGFVHEPNRELMKAAKHVSGLTKDVFRRCQVCLADNGIETDETATVMQAICYMLLGIETEGMLNWEVEA